MRRAGLVLSDSKGRIYFHDTFEAAGMKAGIFFRLDDDELIKLPPESRLYTLPDRAAVGYDTEAGEFTSLAHNPVAAFIPPGYTSTFSSPYTLARHAGPLPLFSYSACAHYRQEIYTTAIRIDRERRHDTRFIDMNLVKKNIFKLRKLFPGNRLIRHLEDCALLHGCPGAQNFFLSRYEGALPTSSACNASCLGCISKRSRQQCRPAQPRIRFKPYPEEICEAALYSIHNIKDPVVSFGQGCEGEPLINPGLIERSIRLIRKKTKRGTINMNTNASSPDALARLFDAGLDSIRVSLNSAQDNYYTAYYKPSGYTFKDVIRSILTAKSRKRFVSLNNLTMPGFTDSRKEIYSLKGLLDRTGVDMIQWRNLNIDPPLYFKTLGYRPKGEDLLGVRQIIEGLRKAYPGLKMGYFNPFIPPEAASPHR